MTTTPKDPCMKKAMSARLPPIAVEERPERLSLAIPPELKLSIWPLMAAPIGACIATDPNLEPTVPPGHHFRYSVVDQDRIHLVQAFDDGSNTYLQFEDVPPVAAEIREGAHGAMIRYT